MDENPEIEALIEAVRQMPANHPTFAEARGMVRLRVFAKIKESYPDLPQEECAIALEQVWTKIVDLAAEQGQYVAGDHPAIGKALLDELWLTLFANPATGQLDQTPRN